MRRRTVGKALVAGAAAVMVAVLAPAASASFGDTIRGGCYGYAVSNWVGGQSQDQGVIGDNSVTTDGSGAPVEATVSCMIQVNGVESTAVYTYSGNGAQAGMNQVAFSATPIDDVEVCQSVVYADGFSSGWTCQPIAQASVPSEVLKEAVRLHPKLVEAQGKLTAKENEIRASKLPKDDEGRKRLSAEREELWKQAQTVENQVRPEVETYLRVPGIVEAQKAIATVERKLRQFEMTAENSRRELVITEEEVAKLKKQLAKLEPQAEEAMLLKEKRKQLKQELLELEFRDAGVRK